MLGALLGTLLPWNAAAAALTLVALAGSGLALYALAREWMPRDPAALAACVYIVNPYAMFVAYERTAFGELLAGIWIPLLLLFALRGSGGDPIVPRSEALIAPLALTVAAVWLTNAPAAVMACYTLGAVAVIAAAVERRAWPIVRAAAASALGVALASFYIVPAAFQRRWVDIARAVAPGMAPEDSYLFGHTGEPFHDQVLRTASWIAVAILVSIAGLVFATGRRLRTPDRQTEAAAIPRRVWIPLLILPLLIVVLMLPLSDPVWKHAPELMFLQFPWRWLLVASTSLAMFCGLALAQLRRDNAGGLAKIGPHTGTSFHFQGHRKRTWFPGIASICVCGAMIAAEQHLFWQPCDEEDMISAQVAAFQGGGFEGTDEYTTIDTDNGAIQQGLPAVRLLPEVDGDEADSSVQVNPAWSSSSANDDSGDQNDGAGLKRLRPVVSVKTWGNESKSFTATTAVPRFAVLRLLDYPAWDVRVNGVKVEQRPHRMDGLMVIPLGAGTSAVQIRYALTRDVRWGRAISLLAVLVLLLILLRQRFRRRRPGHANLQVSSGA